MIFYFIFVCVRGKEVTRARIGDQCIRVRQWVHAHASLCLPQRQSLLVCARRTGGGSPGGDEGRQALAGMKAARH